MADYEVNKAAVKKAHELIDAGRYDTETAWSDAAPSADDGNRQIERHGYEGYGEWHLALDQGAGEDTKNRYGFPYGDFSKVNRAALIHAKQRASQNGHDHIAKVADELLEALDAKEK
ncbi:MAG TPA: hypothetical protein VFN61_01125 [Acidimicrobiales bacterium]|nr:hypothetical protein [Acidimicrobiales bacterium]